MHLRFISRGGSMRDIAQEEHLQTLLASLKQRFSTYMLIAEEDSAGQEAQMAAVRSAGRTLHRALARACKQGYTPILLPRRAGEACVIGTTGPLNPDGLT